MEPTTQKSSPAVPIAIICGFAMIAIAIFFTNKSDSDRTADILAKQNQESVDQEGVPRPVDDNDYILGNPNAPIMMVEYSDYDCPFCKQYHETLRQIMDEYGVTGKLAWAYRQYPLTQLHPNAPIVAEAALCVGDIGGNQAFWDFSNSVFDERAIDEQTNITKLPEFATAAGVSNDAYKECVESDRMQEKLKANIEDGFNSGARGTPYTVLIVGTQQAIINGAQSYETVKGIVHNLVEQLDGNFDPSTANASDLPTDANGVPILN